MAQQEFDFIAIGDTVVDDFIRIKQASVFRMEDDAGSVNEELCFVNGAKIPYEFNKVIAGVGNAANAAVAAARLGLKAAFVTDVGADERGQAIKDSLGSNAVHTAFVRSHPGKITNYHYVLWHNAERTILIKHEEYPYKLPDIGDPKWVYFSSVGESSLPYHDEIVTYLEAHPSIKLAFQPGTFQIKIGAERLARIYKRTDIFFCNTDEARIILQTTEHNGAKLAQMVSGLGPKISIVTDGPAGLYAYETAGGKAYFMPPYPDPKPPYERTGAGDATSSTIASALAMGLPLSTAIEWGPVNAMSVVQYVGAQEGLLGRDALTDLLAKRPADYAVKEISV